MFALSGYVPGTTDDGYGWEHLYHRAKELGESHPQAVATANLFSDPFGGWWDDRVWFMDSGNDAAIRSWLGIGRTR